MVKTAELSGHESRVLHMAMSPDGETIVSAAGDETLRFWKCFADDAKLKAQQDTGMNMSKGNSKMNMSHTANSQLNINIR